MLGVAITAFSSADVIEACLGSLLDCRADVAKVVVTDNASKDDTCERIRRWASANKVSFAEADIGSVQSTDCWLTLVHSPVNGGFAYATNRGIELLLKDPRIGLFWLVNPDCRVTADAAARFRQAGRDQDFSLMGGRTVFEDNPDLVQTDGGRISLWTGVSKSINWAVPIESAVFPDASTIDFITGANCVASRRFIEEVGLMEEDFFLFYEEVDWAFRRGRLPMRFVPDAVVSHYGGTSIGSGSINRRASPLANYFTYRNRTRFICRYRLAALPVVIAYGFAKALQLLIIGTASEARALVSGMLGLRPPRELERTLQPEAWEFVFKTNAGSGPA